MVVLQRRAPAPHRGRWPAAAHAAVPEGCPRSVGDLLIAAAATRSRSGAASTSYSPEVLTRMGPHPASGLEELLPANWRPAAETQPTPAALA
jgi:hypothetical protein